jgi:predicted nucleic acid-binding protein
MPKTPLYYWDSCVFLAWLKDENRDHIEKVNLLNVVQQIQKNEARLITSVLTKAEILRSTLTENAKEKLDKILKRRNCGVLATDDRIWNLVHDLRDYYQQLKIQDNLPTLTTPDAVHLATAIHYEANAFHTFDKNDEPPRRRALIPLSGNIANKYEMTICVPSLPQQTLI